MHERETIVGLIGPSAVGKGYCKDAIKSKFQDSFDEPVVITTRTKRETDGKDRLAGIAVDDFFNMVDRGVVLFAHQPFGEGTDWYGFSKKSLDNNQKPLLTEVHIDNVKPFRERFGDRLFLLALTAKKDYLEGNIRDRGTEDENAIQTRLNAALGEVEKIHQLETAGLIDHVIEVNYENRDRLGEIVTRLVTEVV